MNYIFVFLEADNTEFVTRKCVLPDFNCDQECNQGNCTICTTDLCNKNKVSSAASFNTVSLGWLLLLSLNTYIFRNV